MSELSQPARVRAFRLTVAALLLVSVPALWVALGALRLRLGADLDGVATWPLSLPLILGSLVLVAAAASVFKRRRRSVWLVVAGVLLCQIPVSGYAIHAPALALVGWGWAAVLVYLALRQSAFVKRSDQLKEGENVGAVLAQAVLTSGLGALVVAVYAAGVGVTRDPVGRLAVAGLLTCACAIASAAEWRLVRQGALSRRLASTTGVIGALGLLAFVPSDRGDLIRYAPVLSALRLLVAVAGAARSHELRADVFRFLWTRPALLLILTFLGLSVLGGMILTFPACSAVDRPLDPVDAQFTAVSASCVTGLAVVDTASDFSFLGQLVILVLVQIGALGIMTLSAVATLFVSASIGGHTESAVREVMGADTRATTRRLLRVIMMTTLIVEAIGALLLLPTFKSMGFGNGEMIWRSVFHSVSAFCNAGFSLQSDSLLSLQSNGLGLHVMAFLIMIGGVGFGVLMGIGEVIRRRARRRPWNLHLKLVITANVALLLSAWVGWLVMEWDGSLAGQGLLDRLNNAWFQSVTLRTAGFNSVDFDQLSQATVMMMLVWMFIGASPGSTGGGIKTTTVAVLVAAIASVVRGRRDAEAFGRRISQRAVYRAAAIVTISAGVVFIGSLSLMMTQGFAFERTLFEATSAFATVGLSLGITSELDSVGKLIVMMLMLVGRTGPLTMALLFRRRDAMPVRFPEEEVMVG